MKSFITILLFTGSFLSSFAQNYSVMDAMDAQIWDFAQSLIIDSNSRIYLCSNDGDLMLLKQDSLFDAPSTLTFGGDQLELPGSIAKLSDGSIVVSGISYSGISGTKTTAAFGNGDFWLTKISSNGTILWDKTFGTIQEEYYSRLVVINDTIYLIGGTKGGIDGTKTLPSYGQSDVWLIALDSSGNELFQQVYGGSEDDAYYPGEWFAAEYRLNAFALNNQLIVAAPTTSGISGNKNSPSYGAYDSWILQLDHSGTIIHELTLGGTNVDVVRDVLYTDGKFVLAGYSSSPVSGNKSAALIGNYDAWLVTLDSTLAIANQQTFGLQNTTFYFTRLIKKTNGELLAAGFGNQESLLMDFDSIGTYLWQFQYNYEDMKWVYDIFELENDQLLSVNLSQLGENSFSTILLTPYYLNVDQLSGNNFEIYPNPFENTLYINAKDDAGTLSLCDQTGKMVKAVSVNNGNNSVDLSELESGVYFLQHGNQLVSKIVKYQ